MRARGLIGLMALIPGEAIPGIGPVTGPVAGVPPRGSRCGWWCVMGWKGYTGDAIGMGECTGCGGDVYDGCMVLFAVVVVVLVWAMSFLYSSICAAAYTSGDKGEKYFVLGNGEDCTCEEVVVVEVVGDSSSSSSLPMVVVVEDNDSSDSIGTTRLAVLLVAVAEDECRDDEKVALVSAASSLLLSLSSRSNTLSLRMRS